MTPKPKKPAANPAVTALATPVTADPAVAQAIGEINTNAGAAGAAIADSERAMAEQIAAEGLAGPQRFSAAQQALTDTQAGQQAAATVQQASRAIGGGGQNAATTQAANQIIGQGYQQAGADLGAYSNIMAQNNAAFGNTVAGYMQMVAAGIPLQQQLAQSRIIAAAEQDRLDRERAMQDWIAQQDYIAGQRETDREAEFQDWVRRQQWVLDNEQGGGVPQNPEEMAFAATAAGRSTRDAALADVGGQIAEIERALAAGVDTRGGVSQSAAVGGLQSRLRDLRAQEAELLARPESDWVTGAAVQMFGDIGYGVVEPEPYDERQAIGDATATVLRNEARAYDEYINGLFTRPQAAAPVQEVPWWERRNAPQATPWRRVIGQLLGSGAEAGPSPQEQRAAELAQWRDPALTQQIAADYLAASGVPAPEAQETMLGEPVDPRDAYETQLWMEETMVRESPAYSSIAGIVDQFIGAGATPQTIYSALIAADAPPEVVQLVLEDYMNRKLINTDPFLEDQGEVDKIIENQLGGS